MEVIFHSANLNCVHAMIGRDPRYVGPQPWLKLFADGFNAFFGAEDNVNVIADVGI